MHFAGVTHVERLILGLPVHNVNRYSADLRDRFTGMLEYGSGRVKIEKVVVIPQPPGPLVSASSHRQAEFGKDSAHLVVDVGYLTTDWV